MGIHIIDVGGKEEGWYGKHIAYTAYLEITSQTKFDFHKIIADLKARISVLRGLINNKFKFRTTIGIKLTKVILYLETKRNKIINKNNKK